MQSKEKKGSYVRVGPVRGSAENADVVLEIVGDLALVAEVGRAHADEVGEGGADARDGGPLAGHGGEGHGVLEGGVADDDLGKAAVGVEEVERLRLRGVRRRGVVVYGPRRRVARPRLADPLAAPVVHRARLEHPEALGSLVEADWHRLVASWDDEVGCDLLR